MDFSWLTLDHALGVFALAIAGLALFRGSATDRRVAAIERERRDEEIEAKASADLTAWIDKEKREGSPQAVKTLLVLHNRGRAVAREVELSSPVDILGADRGQDTVSLETVDADQKLSFPLIVTHDLASPQFGVTIRWLDGRGPHEKVVQVSLW
jgi:hypothetical protein